MDYASLMLIFIDLYGLSLRIHAIPIGSDIITLSKEKKSLVLLKALCRQALKWHVISSLALTVIIEMI